MITLMTATTAPAEARPTLAAVAQMLGFTPNLFRAMANAPSTLNGFAALLQAHDTGTLSPVERQIVQLAASLENRCAYCVAGHSAFAAQLGLSAETIQAVRDRRRLADPRYQGLVDFARALVRRRGKVTAAEKTAFLAAGFAPEQMFEVIAGVALKTISNYVNGICDLPLDAPFEAFAWADDDGTGADRRPQAVAC